MSEWGLALVRGVVVCCSEGRIKLYTIYSSTGTCRVGSLENFLLHPVCLHKLKWHNDEINRCILISEDPPAMCGRNTSVFLSKQTFTIAKMKSMFSYITDKVVDIFFTFSSSLIRRLLKDFDVVAADGRWKRACSLPLVFRCVNLRLNGIVALSPTVRWWKLHH